MSLDINPLELAFAQHQANEELEKQARIVIARDLYEGTLSEELIAQLELSLLSGEADEIPNLFNIYAVVIDEVKDRLDVYDFKNTPSPGPGLPDDGQDVEWARLFWQDNQLDELQHEIYEWALVDGEAFVLLQPELHPRDENLVRIRAYPHRRYTDPEVDGDGEGMKLHYPVSERPGVAPIMASKRWTETIYDEQGRATTRQRLTLYIAEDAENNARVEKYRREGSEWVQHQDVLPDGSTEEWPIWWTDNQQESGEPLPLPVIHFRNTGRRSHGRRAQGAQHVLDNIVTALVRGANTIGAPMMLLIGAYPTTDGDAPDDNGTNVIRIGPGSWLYWPDQTPDQIQMEPIKPGDLSQLLDSIDRLMQLTAMSTSTPTLLANRISGFMTSGESLRRLDIRPAAQARRLQDAFGNGWADMFNVAAALMDVYGVEDRPGENDREVHVRWLPSDVLGELPGDDTAAVEDEAAGESDPDTPAQGQQADASSSEAQKA